MSLRGSAHSPSDTIFQNEGEQGTNGKDATAASCDDLDLGCMSLEKHVVYVLTNVPMEMIPVHIKSLFLCTHRACALPNHKAEMEEFLVMWVSINSGVPGELYGTKEECCSLLGVINTCTLRVAGWCSGIMPCW
ncbi:hypothetical protein E2C01_023288 [Portunus trituberculatus]|uniref:Uncharacterized protein n=1 Tax=Portunus trituberculatus TaxID=210409 RepID=A0A5B7E9M1_PORTR|nr:hypothetical protein [Portunus trituberculatus]